MKVSVIFLLAGLLGGCALGPRPYDGVLGYQLNKNGALTRVSYAAEAKTPESKVQELAKRACAKTAGRQAERYSLSGITFTESEKEIAISIPVMVGTTPSGHTNRPGIGGGSLQVSSGITVNESVSRRIKIKTLSAECAPVVSAAP